MKNTEEKSHSEQQAAAQLGGIKEMVRAMEQETAAEDYVSALSIEQCTALLNEAEIDIKELDGDLSENDQLVRAREMVAENMSGRFPSIEPDDFEFDADTARERILEDALEVTVRADWHAPGESPEKPSEFCILLCTGGPAVRLLGDLNEHGEPDRVYMQHQDWGTGWQEFITTGDDNAALLTYARQFYFGE